MPIRKGGVMLWSSISFEFLLLDFPTAGEMEGGA
jgi:hypothetical protein